jgi:hypothetical protein
MYTSKYHQGMLSSDILSYFSSLEVCMSRIDEKLKCFKFMGLKLFTASFGTLHLYLNRLKIFFVTIQDKKFPLKSWYFDKTKNSKQRF